jgi:hypothetical protein
MFFLTALIGYSGLSARLPSSVTTAILTKAQKEIFEAFKLEQPL